MSIPQTCASRIAPGEIQVASNISFLNVHVGKNPKSIHAATPISELSQREN